MMILPRASTHLNPALLLLGLTENHPFVRQLSSYVDFTRVFVTSHFVRFYSHIYAKYFDLNLAQLGLHVQLTVLFNLMF